MSLLQETSLNTFQPLSHISSIAIPLHQYQYPTHLDPSLMAPQARTYPLHGFIVAITVAFFFYLIVLLPKSGGSVLSDKVAIGSKPPSCGNKCMKCSPCIATVVVPNHKTNPFTFKISSQSHAKDDDSYYLLSWKCKCGDKLFQP